MPFEFTENDILVEGLHEATLKDVKESFGGFQKSDRRMTLFKKLEDYCTALKAANITGSIVIDGSFVMKCIDEPEDIDLVLILSDNWDMTADLLPYQYNLVSKRDVRRKYSFDVFAVKEGTRAEEKWIDFFTKINTKWHQQHGFDTTSQKGLVRIAI